MNRLLIISLTATLTASGCSSSNDDADNDGGTKDYTTTSDQGGGGTALSDKELLEACVRTTACGIRAYPALTNCLDAYHKLYVRQGISAAYDAIYHCVNAAGGDCDAVAKCFGVGAGCDKSYQASCDGKVAISCDLIDKHVFSVDCTPTGLDCAVKTDGTFTAVCTPGSCSPGYAERCDGDVHRSCAAGVIETRDCALDGLTCVETKDAVGCAGNQETSCRAGQVTPKCEDDIAVSCEFVRVHRRDCAAEGMTCSNGECVGDTQLCDNALPNRCVGDDLEVCVGNDWQTIDCSALGLGPCEKVPDSDWARCTH